MDMATSEQIGARLREFVVGICDETPFHLRLAAELGVLPLYADWEMCWAIRPDLELISFRHDDSFTPGEIPGLRVEDDPRLRNLALFQGSKQYPELTALIPGRPPDAATCPHCDGAGALLDIEFQNIICSCGGVGWLPKGSELE